LGTAHQNLGEIELAHENMEKAFCLKDRASEREGLYISAHYQAACRTIQKSVEAHELCKQIHPRDLIPFGLDDMNAVLEVRDFCRIVSGMFTPMLAKHA
jgi:hypothetical protein